MPESSPRAFLLDGHQRRPASPARFFHEAFLQKVRGRQPRESFAHSAEPPHVVIDDPLEARFARTVADELVSAHFVRHPFKAYPLDVAPLEDQAPSSLTQFMRWLSSPDAIGFHTGVAGSPVSHAPVSPASVARASVADARLAPLRAFQRVQVQASRMRDGERFPEHADTDDEGLAVIYNFTRDLDPAGSEGGVLEFADGAGLRVPPRFNTLTIFRATDVRHRVTRVHAARGARYSITAFYLLRAEPGGERTAPQGGRSSKP